METAGIEIVSGAMSDGNGKSHTTVGSSGIVLCKLCANYTISPIESEQMLVLSGEV